MYFWLIFLGAFLVDQASKLLITGTMTLNHSIPVLAGIFHITYIRNPGAAFGIMANRTTVFIAISLLVIAGIIVFYYKQGAKRGIIPSSLGLIAGGALGNLVDRVRFGEVIDFLDFRVWPIFNLADSVIVVGSALLVLAFWRVESKS